MTATARQSGDDSAGRPRARLKVVSDNQAIDLPGIETADGRTDVANAKRFAAMHGQNVRWCEPMQVWLIWDGRRWAVDCRRDIDALAKDVFYLVWKQAGKVRGDADAIRFARATGSARGISSLLALARSEPGIAIEPERLDRDEWLLNCPNGTIGLRTGELRPHNRDDYITKLCPTPYDPSAACPLWEGSFLPRIMANRANLIAFLQRAAGYSLTGSVREEVFFFCYGSGRNGKSKFLGALQTAIGSDYCMEAPHDLLMATKDKKHSTELTDLHGKRFVTAIETEDGQRLAEALVKKLTGGERIRARKVFENNTEFDPSHKVWLAANHKPAIRGLDDAIWDRNKLIPFTVYIPPEERDTELKEKLAAEAPGILAWAVRGCLAWQAHGLGEPEEVKEAVQKYRSEEDSVGLFIAECCIVNKSAKVRLKELRERYLAWAEDRGEPAYSGRRFGDTLKAKGFTSHTSNGTWYDGLGLIDDRQQTTAGGANG